MNPAQPTRRHLETTVMTAAVLTALPAALLADGTGPVYAATAYMAGAMLALFNPAALFVQVIAGQALVATLLLGADPPGPLIPVLMVAAVVATAELLAMVGRMRAVRGAGQGGELRMAGSAALTAGLAFGAVLLIGALPGPSGLGAIVVTSAACALAAWLLVRQ